MNTKVKESAKALFCLLLVAILAAGNILSMAAAVRVPTFNAPISDVTLQMGSSAEVRASASVFDGEGQIKYTVQVLAGSSFVSCGDSVFGGSGESVSITVSANNDDILNAPGAYTARIKGEALDPYGELCGTGYSGAFEITVLSSIISSVYGERQIFASGEMAVNAEISNEYTGRKVSFLWTVSDGDGREITDGEYRGVSFEGKDTASLKIRGEPQGIFTLFFSVYAVCGDMSAASVAVRVDFRPEEAFGFAFDGVGIKYYSLSSGKMLTGWQRPVDGRGVYYFDPETGYMATGTKDVEGNVCVFATDGRLINGFTRAPGGTRYFENGAAVTGIKTIGGRSYWFDDITGYAVEMAFYDN